MAATLSASMAFSASAATQVAQDGQMMTTKTYGMGAGTHDMKLTITRIPAEQFEGYEWWLSPAPAGYEYHFFEFDNHGQKWNSYHWVWRIDGAVSNYRLTSTTVSVGLDSPYSAGVGGVAFTATVNGQTYPNCGAITSSRYIGYIDGTARSNRQLAVLLPADCQDAFTFTINPYFWDDSQNTQPQIESNGEVGYVNIGKVANTVANCQKVNYNEAMVYYITGSPSTALFQPTSSWVSDASGWRVQNTDGTYLTNQWYLSDGIWYYLGADGYAHTSGDELSWQLQDEVDGVTSTALH